MHFVQGCFEASTASGFQYLARSKLEANIVGGSNNSALDNAASDANQNMGSSPAGSPTQSCGSAPDPASNQTVSPSKIHWIAIQLVDEQGHAVPGEDYRVTLPDGTVVEGWLDEHGRAKITGIDSGSCKITFPNRDKDVWKPA